MMNGGACCCGLSMLKERTTAERARAEVRQQHLDVRGELLNRLQTAINNRDYDS
jgi:hypothetical protein